MLAFVGLGVVVGWIAATVTKPSSEERIVIWVARPDLVPPSPASSATHALDPGGWTELATSFTVLDSVVADNRLAPPATARQAAASLRKRISVQAPDSNFIVVDIQGTDPPSDARILNSLGRHVIAAAAALGQSDSHTTLATLELELTKQRAALELAEDALSRFRVRTTARSSEVAVMAAMNDPGATRYFTLSTAYDSVRQERAALQRVVANARHHRWDVTALLAIPSVRNTPELVSASAEVRTADSTLRSLRDRPPVDRLTVRRLNSRIRRLEDQTISQAARQLSARMQASQRQLAAQTTDARRDLGAIPRRTLEEARLRRDAADEETRYDVLETQVERLHSTEQKTVVDASVLDSAEALPHPGVNARAGIVLAPILVALMLGIVAALASDRLDPKLRDPEQIGDLDLQLLAVVPHMRRGAELDHSSDEAARAVEAFRVLRLNLRHRQPAVDPVQLTITSPGASDGKSLLAANLALSLAESGHRTLLIDGDIRHGKQHETFGATAHPGLTDFLAGTARADAIARRSTHPNLLIIPSGSRLGHGSELLMSPQLPRLLTAIRPLFDAIVVDSPSLDVGGDALALGAATGNILLVFRKGATERRSVRSRLALLRYAPLRVIGAVLNDIGAADVYDAYGSIDDSYIPGARKPGTAENLPVHVQVQTQGD